ncbi:MAG TPA: hypothetical protein VFT46_08940, partial [Holophagaceae bacterium]|nr:hypothetical protein [Holophagaceae bacterium]
MPASRLDDRLDALLAPAADGSALEGLLRWLRAAEAGPERTARLRELAGALAAHPGREALEARLAQAWRHASAVRLLAETGLPDRATFLGEALRKVVDGFVPRGEAAEDLHALLVRLRLSEADAAWVESLDESDLAPWRAILAPDPEAWALAVRLLAARAAAVGLSRDLLDLDPEPDGESPFLRLPAAAAAWSREPQEPAAQRAWDETRS